MVAWLKQHMYHPITVAELANAHHVSSRTVSRLFAAQGTTPMNTLWQLRLTASRKALLEGRARSITEVAIDHGFKDVSHFSQAFRKAFGCSPTSLTKNRSLATQHLFQHTTTQSQHEHSQQRHAERDRPF